MNVTILASGSKHNCMVVEMAGQYIMIDAGLGYKDSVERMLAAGIDPERLSGILCTHAHGDHTYGLVPLVRKLDVPVFMSGGCAYTLGEKKALPAKVMRFQPGQSFKIGKLIVGTFAVPHDAAEPVGFSIVDGQNKFAMATDLGSVPEGMMKAFDGADVMFCESNHDPDLAQLGEKHPAVLKRVVGPMGHLSNTSVAEFLQKAVQPHFTTQVILGHLSREDNDRDLCRLSAERAIDGRSDLKIAKPEGGVD